MNSCRYCLEIPFDKLPSENEDALPHQPSLAELALSAKTCGVCKLINNAVEELQDRIANGWRQTFTLPKLDNKDIRARVYRPNRQVEFELKEGKQNWKPLFPHGLPAQIENAGPIRPWLYGNWWIVNGDEESPKLLGMGVRIGRGPSPFEAEGGEEWGDVIFRGSSLRLQTTSVGQMNTAYEGLGKIIPKRPRCAYSGSALALDQAARWLLQCNRNHSCVDFSAAPPLLPYRILSLKEYVTGQITLLQSINQRGRYIALSHSWGTSHTLTTTRSTVDAHRQGISLSDLPKTYLEAVHIATKLQVDYLWIDAVCIIQDDPEDWSIQAAQMGRIYANAYLTIAASASTGDDYGCSPSKAFRKENRYLACENRSIGKNYWDIVPSIEMTPERSWLEAPEGPVTFAFYRNEAVIITEEWLPPSTKAQPSHFVIGLMGEMFDPLADEPLNKRGWVLQERILSRRTLHFGAQQMFWECSHGIESEDGCLFPKFNNDSSINIGSKSYPLTKSATEIFRPESDEYRSNRLAILTRRLQDIDWTEMVSEYSRRNLTVEQDKLPALAGIASSFAEAPGWEDSTYLAGLWSHSLRYDLCWRVYSRVENRQLSFQGEHPLTGETLSGVRRPAQYRAPTWSWASLDASVTFHCPSPGRRLFHLDDWYVMCDSDSPFTRVVDAWLELSATLISVQRLDREENHGVAVEICLGTLGTFGGVAYFDLEVILPCWGLIIDERNCLLLRGPDNEDGSYERIGLADIRFMRDLPDLPMTTVRIV